MPRRARPYMLSAWLIAAWLLIGVVANVGVAWGVAVVDQRMNHQRALARSGDFPLTAPANQSVVTRTNLTWPIEVPADWPPRPDVQLIRSEMWATERVASNASYSSRDLAVVLVAKHGFPLRALSDWTQMREGPDPALAMHVKGGRVSLDWLPWKPDGVHRLPIRPLWPGFALNTLFYAALAWAFWQLPLAIRGRRRRSKGLCVRCGYDRKGIGGGSPCPECGTKPS